MKVSIKDNLSKKILIWYDKNKRDLPWRKSKKDLNPYQTWISEIMLQQTTVEAVIPVPDCDPLFGSSRSKGLRKVVDDWIAGGTKRATVETTYGLIQDWDTSRVTSMYYLFAHKQFFNADLSKWNVAEVTSMRESTFSFSLSSTSSSLYLIFYSFLRKLITN